MNKLRVLTIFALAILIASCNSKKEEVTLLKQSDFPAPPVAEVKPDTFTNFNKQRIDNYFWLNDKNNPEVIEYLNAENAYTETVMNSTKELQRSEERRVGKECRGRWSRDH